MVDCLVPIPRAFSEIHTLFDPVPGGKPTEDWYFADTFGGVRNPFRIRESGTYELSRVPSSDGG